MDMNWAAVALIFGVMTAGGILGAVAACCIEFDAERKTPRMQPVRIRVLKNLFPGIAAAYLTPIFLKLVSSDMVDFDSLFAGESAVSQLFYLFGFSVIASVSAKSFIPALSNRIKKMLVATEQRTARVEQELESQISDKKTLVELESYLNECRGADKEFTKYARERSEQALAGLKNALVRAPSTTRDEVCNRITSFRMNTPREQGYRLRCLAPVLQLLVELDNENQRYHAEYAYVLKDMHPRSDQRALEELNAAIRIRNEKSDRNFHNAYEYNRAVVKIRLDSEYNQGAPSSPRAREDILADLREAARNSYWRRVILGGEEAFTKEVREWIDLNNGTSEI